MRSGRGFDVIETLRPKLLAGVAPKVAVQGLGNAGATIAELLFDAGDKVVAVSASRGAIFSGNGLHVPSVRKLEEESLLANAGGVTVSHCEWSQNRSELAWTAQEGRSRLRGCMVAETERLWELHEEAGASLRVAAYVQALSRIGEAVDATGHKQHFRPSL